MQLSIKYKFAFLCLPKCGSTSVEKALRKKCPTHLGGHPSLKHINAQLFKRHIRPLLRKVDPAHEIETFCIMREPVDRVRSWYEYQLRPELKDPSHPAHERYNAHVSFEEFVEILLSDDRPANRPRFSRIGTQAGFVRLADGSIGVDKIFRLDRMQDVADYLTAKIGAPLEIKVANKSARPEPKAGLFRRLAVKPEPRERPPKFVLPEPLLARLKEHLADDYQIYTRLPLG